MDPMNLNPVYAQFNATQIVVVTNTDVRSSTASLYLYEKKELNWVTALGPIMVKIGRNGMTDHKVEKDGKTPIGLFPLGIAFGWEPSISNKNIPYRQTTSYDYWIDDPHSSDYNKWIRFLGNPNDRWASFEQLHIPPYKYALVIQYNCNPTIPGKGSAIFIHVWRNKLTPTAGCIALSENKMIELLNVLDEKKNPILWVRN